MKTYANGSPTVTLTNAKQEKVDYVLQLGLGSVGENVKVYIAVTVNSVLKIGQDIEFSPDTPQKISYTENGFSLVGEFSTSGFSPATILEFKGSLVTPDSLSLTYEREIVGVLIEG